MKTRVIVAGTRDLMILTGPGGTALEWLDTLLCTAFRTLHPHYTLEIVSGASGNIDLLGERWAEWSEAELTCFAADWNTHGKAAGPIRNRQMAEYAAATSDGALVLIWDGKSKGSANMLQEAKRAGLRVVEVRL
jgi:hypothetical protein